MHHCSYLAHVNGTLQVLIIIIIIIIILIPPVVKIPGVKNKKG